MVRLKFVKSCSARFHCIHLEKRESDLIRENDGDFFDDTEFIIKSEFVEIAL